VSFGRDSRWLHTGGCDKAIDRSLNCPVAVDLGSSPNKTSKVSQSGMRTEPRPETVDLAAAHPRN